MSAAGSVAVGAVRLYQWTVAPVLGCNCRFEPNCSEYAVQAVRGHGALRGGVMAAGRILRCNPWTPGGYDPPPASHARPPG